MKVFTGLLYITLVLLCACSGQDPKQEIHELIAQNKIVDAKKKYEEVLAKNPDTALEREYINFLYENRHFRDFKMTADSFLIRFPQDGDIKLLVFKYYDKLAKDAERQGKYATTMQYIVNYLLDPAYPDHRKWESRQTTIFRKWFQVAVDQKEENMQRDVMNQMMVLGFDNLAKDLDPDLFNTLRKDGEDGVVPTAETSKEEEQ